MWNSRALAYWKEKTYSPADVLAVMKDLEREGILALALEFREDAKIDCSLTKRYGERCLSEGHLPTIVRYFSTVHERSGGNYHRGSIIVLAEDHIWGPLLAHSQRAPLFAFGRPAYDACTLLMPDPAFIASKAYQKERAQIEEATRSLPWERKQPTVFWRGASSNPGLDTDAWDTAARIRLCMRAKEINDPQRIDAGLSKLIRFDNPLHEKRILDAGIVKGPVPFQEFLKYRYQVDVDGFANAWKSCFLKLASHCLTLKVESGDEQWYYPQLVPWKNFVPLKTDLSDLAQVLAWLPEHDAEARAIAEEAFRLIERLTLESAVLETTATLHSVLMAQRPLPTPQAPAPCRS